MADDALTWLLETGNPAVKHRTKIELLGLEDDPAEAFTWIVSKLPDDWYRVKGLWYAYYINALAECGLNQSMMPSEWFETAMDRIRAGFDFGCEAFMLLQAMVALGFGGNPDVQKIFALLHDNRLPDGGFLCERRKGRLKYIPKSCYKADYYALRLCSCCRKKGIILDIEQELIRYFLSRNLLFRRDNLDKLILGDNEKEGSRNSDVFYPFEPMRMGIQNIMETISSLGYGNDPATAAGWNCLNSAKDDIGRVILAGTLTKSWLPKEKVGKPSAWATFYALLAEKER
ncbi:MAG: hypothetical protein HDQ98_03750 [Lachnospiraceae bacterium]|nr:hypothetical protein [Lachnospiraceae bacterium]